MLLTLALMLAGALATPASASYKRVHPTVLPGAPTRSEPVVVRFRARETLDGNYSAEVEPWPEQACGGAKSATVRAPRRGRVVRLRLRPPRFDGRRWCAGPYRATVFFKQTVRCKPPVQCGDSVAMAVGSTKFTVVAER